VRRMRALELIRQELHSISKYAELNAIQQISGVLRRHLIQAMLDVVEEYQFSSAACQEAIEVLDILKVAFDDEDIESLKEFVRRHLATSKTTHYTFESGRRTTNANLATIVKIGIALKRLTTTGSTSLTSNDEDETTILDDHAQEAEEEEQKSAAPSTAKSFKHLNDSQWSSFCNGRLQNFETKWSKKLETYTLEDRKQIQEEEEVDVVMHKDSDSSDDDDIQLHAYPGLDKMRRSMTDAPISSLLEEGAGQLRYKDDWEVGTGPSETFNNNQYWKVAEPYSIDDLLKEQDYQ